MTMEAFEARHISTSPEVMTEIDCQRAIGGIRTSKNQNVSKLFQAVGVQGFFNFVANENSYDVRPDDLESNWLYAAFRGFQRLQQRNQQEGKTVDTFASIGSGQGIDVIGAYYLFTPRPRTLVATDINFGVKFPMRTNVLRHIQDREDFPPRWKDEEVRTYCLHGSLCKPLRQHGISADVIYANLPNIPEADAEKIQQGQLSASYIDEQLVADAPSQYGKYHLGLQHTFLRDAHSSLKEGGSALINLGGRVPVELVQQMFQECGYRYEELYTALKVQSEPEEVLTGYSERGEKKHGVEFDFFRFDQAQNLLAGRKAEKFAAVELKNLLRPSRVSATEGLDLHAKGERIGHIVQLIRGMKL